MKKTNLLLAITCSMFLVACTPKPVSSPLVALSHGEDESAGGDECYIVTTPTATYY